ncbi:FUSC family protein, partial [Azotobacter chroococcum]|nr:FUSC family protein [Azotobacter chroococcum]
YTAVMIGLPATFDPDGAFMQALWRVLEITVGILCTGLVMGLILPQTSGATLRSTLATRFRDFAGVACAGLAGELEPQRMEEVSARLAAQAVALENLRNASAFEDPNIRLRSGRLARLNNEFMVLSTRFHALYQLLQRLQGETGVRVLEALQPCLAQVGSELEPLAGRLYSDQDAANLALGLATSKQALMQRIRDGRQQLVEQQADEAQLTDFNTAAELLFRFTDDLHGYA